MDLELNWFSGLGAVLFVLFNFPMGVLFLFGGWQGLLLNGIIGFFVGLVAAPLIEDFELK